MSKKQGRTSGAESDQPEKDSVYDFLYQDVRRIGSFLAQFEPHGHLQSLTRTSSVAESSASSFEAGGHVGVAIAGLNTSGHQHASKSLSDVASKLYDPLWQNSLAFLDYLEQRNLIGREISQAKIGQFALVTGRLAIMDLTLIKAILLSKRGALTVGKNLAEQEWAKQADIVKTKKEKSDDIDMYTSMVQELFKALPYAVSSHLIGSDFGVWSSLRPDGMSVTIDDLLLKHGTSSAGSWNMLGIVDALPDSVDVVPDPYFEEGTAVGATAALLSQMRPKFGRPSAAYGMTPLLIFREVSVG